MFLQERLDQQKKEAEEDPNYGKSFKGQPTKEEKKAKRKQIIATIGETQAHVIVLDTQEAELPCG